MNYEELIKNNESINEELVEWINDRTINIPLHQNLTDDDVSKIIDTIRSFK